MVDNMKDILYNLKTGRIMLAETVGKRFQKERRL